MSAQTYARAARACGRGVLLLACAFAAMRFERVRAQPQDDRDVTSDAAQDAMTGMSSSTTDHVAPTPPQQSMASMSGRQMIDTMDMNDSAIITMLSVDRLEWFSADAGVGASWKASASVGNDFDKLRVRTEGEYAHGAFDEADAEVLWGHAVSAFWDTQLGIRRDFGRGNDRDWIAFGVQGLAPYGFEVEATAYAGNAGRTALRLEVEYEALLTQRLILQPRLEINAYGRSDPAARIGSGLSDAEFGVRLRYEIRREFAPYVGIERTRCFGETASLIEAGGLTVCETRWVLGVRIWY